LSAGCDAPNDARQTPTPLGLVWSQVATPDVSNISVGPDRFIYGVATDNTVYRTKPKGTWECVTDRAVTYITAAADGLIYGIGLDNAVYRTAPYGHWEWVAPPWVTNIGVTASGYIYGLGGQFVFAARPYTSQWEQITYDGAVSNLSVTPNGEIYGVAAGDASFAANSVIVHGPFKK
jgi:hypothetical protein